MTKEVKTIQMYSNLGQQLIFTTNMMFTMTAAGRDELAEKCLTRIYEIAAHIEHMPVMEKK